MNLNNLGIRLFPFAIFIALFIMGFAYLSKITHEQQEHAGFSPTSENLKARVTKRRGINLNYNELTTVEYDGCRWVMYKASSGDVEINHHPACPGLAHK